ncbi:hypothetical protein HDG38_000850 [Paraburkholderia sp. WSM4177]|nr:hypothetical protein [Paraburkholderia sp. WSM4177]MBB5482938.1 hypothetical protein [Paraburkholderia sp. WSM4180]
MGEVGAGQTAKLCNQAIVTATVAAIAEAVSLAQRSGIDAAKLSEALAGGWADSVLLRTFVPRMTQSGLAPIGALRTFQKDVDTVAATAYENGTPMPVASTVQQLLRLGAAMGLADADFRPSSTFCRRRAAARTGETGRAGPTVGLKSLNLLKYSVFRRYHIQRDALCCLLPISPCNSGRSPSSRTFRSNSGEGTAMA